MTCVAASWLCSCSLLLLSLYPHSIFKVFQVVAYILMLLPLQQSEPHPMGPLRIPGVHGNCGRTMGGGPVEGLHGGHFGELMTSWQAPHAFAIVVEAIAHRHLSTGQYLEVLCEVSKTHQNPLKKAVALWT